MSVQQDHPRRLASDIVRRWRQGQDADACLAMEAHPELAACRSAALELAYGEYRWRIDRGEEVQTTHFASRFPHCRTSLARRIAVDQFVSENPSRFTELPESSWPGEGDEFLNFTLLEELGRGAIGRVFLAEDHDLGRQVVVKIAPLGTQEAQTLSKLSHQNVVPVYTVEDDLEYNRVGICMPFLGRGTLEDFLDCAFGAGQGQPPMVFAEPLQRLRGTYSQQERQQLQGRRDEFLWRANYVDGILHWGRQLADALAHTHDRGVRHLDIKPSNVLLTPDGLPMLLDFNLSAVQGADSILIGGTLPYMSPEQLRATAAGPRTPQEPIDDRSDIFSLGVILYELLAGEHPFGPISWKNRSEQVLLELSRRHQRGARPVNQVNRQVDRRSAAVIGRCLSADPHQRPPTAAGLRDELDRCLTAPRRWHRYARGRPWTSLLTLLALVLLVGGLVALLALRPARHQRSYWSGLQLYEQGRYGEAEHAFTDAIDHHRDHFAAHFARGQTRLQLQDYTGAISDFDWCHQNEPHPILIVSSAYACELAGQHDRAMLRYVNLQRAN
jgi:serine/threonine protein kinase